MGDDVRPMVPVRFDVPATLGVHHAELVAEFVSWTPLAMDRADDGSHHVTVLVESGRAWRYGFVFDGLADDDSDPRVLVAPRPTAGPTAA